MKPEEILQLIPITQKKSLILAGYGAIIGGGLGAYLFGMQRMYLLFALSITMGTIFGWIAGKVIGRWISLEALTRLDARTNLVGGILGLLLSIAGIVGYLRTGNLIGVIGAAFFALCGVYLIHRYRR